MTDTALPSFRWLGHGSVHVPGPPRIAVDPWKWRYDDLLADLVLVTHGHVDHCCEDDLARVAHPGSLALGPPSVEPRLRRVFGDAVRVLEPGSVFRLAGVTVRALPHAGPDTDGRPCAFHPPGEGLAYLVETPTGSLLFLGDSVALDAHSELAPDVAFFAVSGLAGMGPEEAAEAAARVQPRLAVPVSWGDLHGRFPHARRFVEACAERGVHAAVATTD